MMGEDISQKRSTMSTTAYTAVAIATVWGQMFIAKILAACKSHIELVVRSKTAFQMIIYNHIIKSDNITI